MTDYDYLGLLSSQPRGTVAATDVMALCTGSSAALKGITAAQIVPTLVQGTTTLTGVGTLTLSGGTLTGSNGGSTSLGSGTLTVSGGGGATISPGLGAFWTGSSWNRPASSSGTVVNSSNVTVTDVAGGPIDIFTSSGLGNNSIAGIDFATSGSFTKTALIGVNAFCDGYSGPGMWATGSDGNRYGMWCVGQASNNSYFQQSTWGTAYSLGAYNTTSLHIAPPGLITMQATWDGTTLSFYYLADNSGPSASKLLIYSLTPGVSVGAIGVGYARGSTVGGVKLWGLA